MTAPSRRTRRLWADWCAATGHRPDDFSDEALARFASAVPSADAESLRAAPTAHPRARRRDPWAATERHWAPLAMSLAQCPTYGWPAAVPGRRDAFLVVLTRVLRMPRQDAVAQRARNLPGLYARLPDEPVDGVCVRCVTSRWMEVVATYDRWSKVSVRQQVWTRPADGLSDSLGSARPCNGSCSSWADVAASIPHYRVLTPAIDQHGSWTYWDHHKPLTPRALTAILAQRCDPEAPSPFAVQTSHSPASSDEPGPAYDETTLARLDDVVAAAEEANARVEALLAEFEKSLSPGRPSGP